MDEPSGDQKVRREKDRNSSKKTTLVSTPNGTIFSSNHSRRLAYALLTLVLEEDDDAESVVLTLRFQGTKGESEPYVRPFIESLMKNEHIKKVFTSINAGFHIGLVPQDIKFGLSGSYFLRGADRSNLVASF